MPMTFCQGVCSVATVAPSTGGPVLGASGIGDPSLLLAGALLAGGLVLIAWPLVVRSGGRWGRGARRRAASSSDDAGLIDPRFDPARADAERREIESIGHDVVALARAASRELEERAAALRALIAASDERLRELEAARHHAAEDRVMPRPRGEPAVIDVSRVRVRPDDGATTPGDLSGSGSRSVDDPLRRHVFTLSDAGRTASQIALETGEPRATIELMLKLRGG